MVQFGSDYCTGVLEGHTIWTVSGLIANKLLAFLARNFLDYKEEWSYRHQNPGMSSNVKYFNKVSGLTDRAQFPPISTNFYQKPNRSSHRTDLWFLEYLIFSKKRFLPLIDHLVDKSDLIEVIHATQI